MIDGSVNTCRVVLTTCLVIKLKKRPCVQCRNPFPDRLDIFGRRMPNTSSGDDQNMSKRNAATCTALGTGSSRSFIIDFERRHRLSKIYSILNLECNRHAVSNRFISVKAVIDCLLRNQEQLNFLYFFIVSIHNLYNCCIIYYRIRNAQMLH